MIPVASPAQGVVLTFLAVGVALMYIVRRLGRARPELRIGGPFTAAYAIRLLAVVAINATGVGASLRGGDEYTFLAVAKSLAAQPIGLGDFPHAQYGLHVVVFAFLIKTGFLNETAIRIVQIGLALTGAILMVAAVYDLAGPRAARIAAWCIAFEPASIFFNSEIHKEALMDLGAGLVVFGGVWVWKRLDLRGIMICALGCFIAIETRGYAGWFMACGVAMLVLHASLRNMTRQPKALPLVYAILIAGMVATPTILQATGGSNLKLLQASQQAYAQSIGTGTGGPNSNNLALETVNVSSRGAIIASLPTKIRELILMPYPWQLQDTNQLFGAFGTLVAYVVLFLLIRYAWLSRGQVFGRAGPLLYPLLFELIAYSLTVGNAGTGFRYRTHLTWLAIGALMVLRTKVLEERAADRETEDDPSSLKQGQRSTTPVTA